MSYDVRLTRRARQDLEDAYLWIAARAPEAAVTWFNDTCDAVDTLRTFPRRCGLAQERDAVGGELRQLILGNYRAIFSIDGSRVTVLHVRHAARRRAGGPERP